MTQLNYDKMGKEALRAEMRGRELSYSKLDNAGMREALRANDAELGSMLEEEDEFEMSQAELEQQAGRKPAELSAADQRQITDEAASRPAPQPRTRAGLKIEANREERNGVKRPSLGGVCREVWDYLDNLTDPTAKLVRDEAPHRNWNPNNAMIEFYQWRKFNGISGRKAK